MPLINGDVKSLEIVVAADMSRDPVLMKELLEKQDIHENNRKAFGLPSRLIAKVLVFRILYGGSAYSFAHDSDFMGVSTSEKFWQKAIDAYYEKYRGIHKWHNQLIDTAKRDGYLEIFSGRQFPIEPDYSKREPWPLTVIKNYPVQSGGAELVMLARLEAAKRIREAKIKALLISTIHDSLVADAPSSEVETVGRILNDSVEAVPKLCKQVFGYDFSLPLTAEVQYGPNKKDLKDLTFA